MEIFKLFGSIMVDSSAAEKSISETDKKAEGLGSRLASGLGTAAKWGAGVATAAATAGAALYGAANKASEAADKVDKGSIRMGVSTDYYQELSYAAGQCGVEMSTMEKAAKKLEGTDLNLDQAMGQIMSLTTEEERSAAAAELFGDSVAYQMAPLLAAGGEGFDDLRDRAHELGLVMGEDAVAQGVLLGDTMSDVKQSFGAIVSTIGVEVMPLIQTLLEWVLSHMPEIQAVVQGTMQIVGDALKIIADVWNTYVAPALNAAISFITATLAPTFRTVFQSIIQPAVQNTFTGIRTLWDTVLKPVFTGITTFLSGVFTQDWRTAFQGLSDIASGIFNGLIALVKTPLNSIIELINNFLGRMGTIKIPDWVPEIGGASFSMPQIPYLAAGGDIVSAGSVVVGDAGPELLQLPQGARVTPLGRDASDLSGKLDAILNMMALYMPNIGSNIVLDNGALVGAMAPQMDRTLGNMSRRRRGG